MNIETELIDFTDTLNFTLSIDFLDKWKFKYGERLLRLFQIKILDSLKRQKPLKLEGLAKFFVNDSGYNPDLIRKFFIDIDFEIYFPIISGRLKDISQQEI